MDNMTKMLIEALDLSEEENNKPLLNEAKRTQSDARKIIKHVNVVKAALLIHFLAVRSTMKQNQRMLADLQKKVERIEKKQKKNQQEIKGELADFVKEWQLSQRKNKMLFAMPELEPKPKPKKKRK